MPFKHLIPDNVKYYLRKYLQIILTKSLKGAISELGLNGLLAKLTEIVPDITNQYSLFKVDSTYIKTKVRCQHTFQISLVNEIMSEFREPVIVDIGDSAGTHLEYIIGLYQKNVHIECLSVNLDAEAVKRIRAKGLKAIHARAEELQKYDIDADILLCFEIMEHLMNPFCFLHELALKTNAKYLIITVPYLSVSRVGLHHIMSGRRESVYAENTHILELNPYDWKLVAKHSGWNVVKEKIYLQYPKKRILRITKSIWRKMDFEGFYGMILKRDDTWSSMYRDW